MPEEDPALEDDEVDAAPEAPAPAPKKFKSSKPVQTAAWSNKTDAADKKEARRLKKLKKVKAVNGVIVRERETMGEDEGGDWKEAIREERERKRAAKAQTGKGKRDVEMAAVMYL